MPSYWLSPVRRGPVGNASGTGGPEQLLPNIESGVVPLENVIDVLKSSSDRKSNFFHLFYKAKGDVDDLKKKSIVNTIAKKLIAEASR